MTAIRSTRPIRPGRCGRRKGIQRGSVADMPLYPGDPLTPGVGATKDAKRLKISEATTILKIPALPISYADAQVFLAALGGPVAPPDWRGALPITYHVGPGTAVVHLAVKSDWSIKPIYDVIATMKGSTYPDQWVVRGNHHDGWVFGATDPLSGQVALLAEAQGDRRTGQSRAGSPSALSFTRAGTPKSRCFWARPNGLETHASELKKKTRSLHQLRHAMDAASWTSGAARTSSIW